ncbi:sensor histidine kinase [Salinisphaera sp.]|uniref:sensor histidine kinase n=1 Tax=Salinisphaera sp. TaxID=1914330 RepID=UPI002D78394E|nr:ATP-binding protein [Salinisphaera sp.]HET7312955.1 ATP-binding protein [Salinisphaera sp.]
MTESSANVPCPVAGDHTGNDTGGFAEQALELLLAHDTTLALCSLTLDGRVRIWHASAERVLGHFADDVVGRRLDHLAPAEHRHQGLVTRALFDASDSGETQLDLPLVRRDGRRKTCRLEIRPQFDAEPGFAVLIRETGPGFDSPCRRRARHDSRAAHRANLTLLGGEPGWIGLGIEAEIQHVSPKGAEVLDVAARDWVGRPLSDLLRPTDASDWYVLLHRAVETGVPQTSVVVSPDAAAQHLCWPATVLALRDGADHQIAGFTLALGAPEETAERRTAPVAGYEQSAERAWFNAVVHDMREPLRRVREYVDALRYGESDQLSTRAVDYLGRVDSAVERLQNNIGGILRLARIDNAPFVPEPIDLTVLIQAVLDDLEMLIHDHGATVDVGRLGMVAGDPVQLRLLFQNLIDNSIRYRRPGAPPRIRISRAGGDADAHRVQLRYIDNARGFEDPEAMLAGRHRDKIEGTGIGLDLCRRVARRHRGDLKIVETHSQGTTFLISLTRHDGAKTTNAKET